MSTQPTPGAMIAAENIQDRLMLTMVLSGLMRAMPSAASPAQLRARYSIAEQIDRAAVAPVAEELLASLKSALAYIEMTMAHRSAMSVAEILRELEHVKQVATVQTGHHVGCSATTRTFNLEKARELIAKHKGLT